jgi:hypothetical protein
MVRFSGMKPWREEYDNIEVEARDKLLDLHNFGTVLGVEYRPPDLLEFRFDLEEPPWRLSLQFLSVHNFQLGRTELTTHDPDQLDGISFARDGAEGLFRVTLGDGLTFTFNARDVVAIVDDSED